MESKLSLTPEVEQSPTPQSEETGSRKPEESTASELKDSLVFKMDEFNTKESQEPQQQKPQRKKSLLPKPKKPVILTMEEHDVSEEMEQFDLQKPQETQSSETQKTQSSETQETPVLKTEETNQPSPEVEPSQELKADISGDDIEEVSSDKFAALKITAKRIWEQIDNKLLTPKPGVDPVKHKATVIMVPLLFVVLIFVLRSVFGGPVSSTEAAVGNNTSGKAATSSDNSIEWEIPEPYKSKSRNPLRLGPAEKSFDDEINPGQFVQLDLRGILYTEDNPSAAVDGRIVYQGEKVRGVTVVKITKENVEFELNGKRWTQKVR